MRPLKTLRIVAISFTLLLFGVSMAFGQSFELTADATALTPEGGSADAHCLVESSDGSIVFFNSEEGGIYIWDGSTLVEHTSSTTLNSNIDAESGDINRCDAVAIDGEDNVYFSLRSTANNVNFIYRTDVSDSSTFTYTEVNGINGLAVDGSTLYLAGVADFDATGNGVFEMSSDLSGDTSAVAKNPDLNLGDASLAVDSEGIVYGFNTGSAIENNAIVSVDPSASSPSFNLFVDPYANGTLTESDGLIGDLDIVSHQETEYIVVYNGSFTSEEGDEWGAIQISDQSVARLFTRADVVANLEGVTSYVSGFTEPMAVNSAGEVTIASRAASFDGEYYLATVSGAAPLPVEMTSFNAIRSGSSVELTWQTASETNNAGFRVQRQAESGTWSKFGFVESNAPSGTATEAQTYRYQVDRELDAGTHRFRLQQVDLDGSTHPSKVVTVDIPVEEALTLSRPAPNPSSEAATVSITLKEATEATVSVYNVVGQKVATLYDGTPQAGHTTNLTLNTEELPSGVYFVRLQADGQSETRRLTVVR